MAYGYHLEAEFADGYVHSELALNDRSPFDTDRNIFYDITNQLPVPQHGKMVRFSCIGPGVRHDVDWHGFPADAKVIYKRWMERDMTADGQFVGEPRAIRHIFGYEYHDADGTKHKEVLELG